MYFFSTWRRLSEINKDVITKNTPVVDIPMMPENREELTSEITIMEINQNREEIVEVSEERLV